jgi:hypothetical protein
MDFGFEVDGRSNYHNDRHWNIYTSRRYRFRTLRFCDKPQKIINKTNKNDHVITAGDLSGRKLPS